MKILRTELEDYGTFAGKHVFHYADRGLTLILGENQDEPRMNSNGSGKSTFVEVMDWCLWGVVPKRGEPADSIIHEGATSCSAATYLEDDDGTVGVIRRARPAKLEFWVGGVDMTALDARETQARIEHWLGLNREVFHAVVFLAQDDRHRYADVGDADRMAILSRIIPELGEIDALLERAKARRDALREIAQGWEAQIATKKGELGALTGFSYAQQIEEWEQGRAETLAQLDREIARVQAELSGLQVPDIAALQQQLAALEGRVWGMDRSWEPGLKAATDAHANLVAHYQGLMREQQRLGGERHQMETLGIGKCTRCKSMVTPEHLQAEIVDIDRSLAQIGAALQATTAQGHQAAAEVTRWTAQKEAAEEQYRRLVQQGAEEVAQARQAVSAASGIKQQRDSLLSALEGHKRLQTATLAQVNPFVLKEQEVAARGVQVAEELVRLEESVARAQAELAIAEFWVEACGSKGLKSYILDAKLGELNAAVNEGVYSLTGGTWWVRFETQRQTKTTKKLVNAPSLRVFKWNPDGTTSERGYKSCSPGERRRLSLAIDFGLNRLVARRARKRYDLMVLDEVVTHVDARGGEALVDVLRALRREKSSIFVIEHDAEFQAQFENRIVVRKEGGRSQVVEDSYVERIQREGPEAPCVSPGTEPQATGAEEAVRDKRVRRRAAVRRDHPAGVS